MKLSFGLLSLLNAVLFVGCSAMPVYPQNPLVHQILKPRFGYDGKLTNRACLAYDGVECQKETIMVHDLADENFRKQANALNFICNVGGRRFKICLDKPGLCRHYETDKECFLFFCKKTERLEEYIPADNYDFMLNARVRCFNKETYPFDQI